MLLPECGKWNFHFFINNTKELEKPVLEFDPAITRKGRGKMSAALDIVQVLKKNQWKKPQPASIIQNHIYVIRFVDETSMQRRLFGHFYDEHDAFVITLTGYEKGNVYYPKSHLETCVRIKPKCDGEFFVHTRQLDGRCGICCRIEGKHAGSVFAFTKRSLAGKN